MALMPGNSRNLSRSTIGIVVLLNARNNDEFGGCKRISAPTPSVRLPVSSEIPDVNPTTTRMRITSSATARMLTVVRTGRALRPAMIIRSEEHTSELQSHSDLVCRLLLEKKKKSQKRYTI